VCFRVSRRIDSNYFSGLRVLKFVIETIYIFFDVVTESINYIYVNLMLQNIKKKSDHTLNKYNYGLLCPRM
jgi:hypothetical protein